MLALAPHSNVRSRCLSLLLVAMPCLFYVACSNDEATNPVASDDAGVDAPTGTGEDGSNVVDPDAAPADGGTSDADPASCTGNPLSADAPTGGVVIDNAALRPIATGRFLDGPQWIDEGTLVYSEVHAQVIVKNTGDGGTRSIIRATGLENLPIGNAHAGGHIFTALARIGADAGSGAILRTLVDGGDPQTFAVPGVNSPNDIVASSKGFVYFTDPAFQATVTNPVTGVYRIGIDGTGLVPVQQFNAGANPGARADGIALSADEKSLFVGFFDEKRIVKYTIDEAGMPANPAVFPPTPIDQPTGIAVDTAGNVWVAESGNGGAVNGRVEVFSPDGMTKWGELVFTEARPTGIAFGGADAKTVYITTERGDLAMGTLFTTTTRCAGVR